MADDGGIVSSRVPQDAVGGVCGQNPRMAEQEKGSTLGAQLRINTPRVVHETIDGEVIVIDLATGTYFSFQGGSADVWGLIVAGQTLDEMVSNLTAAYVGDPESIRGTLETFLKELESEQLVEKARAEDPVAGSPPEVTGNGEFTPYLEKHTDMAELILLDPVHEVDSMGWPHRPSEDSQSAQ